LTKTLARDPARRCKRFEEWPSSDQTLWLAALVPGDVLEAGGQRAGYRLHTNRKIAVGYGRWLQWVDYAGLFDPTQAPGVRITRKSVAAYVADLATRNSTSTQIARLEELFQAACVMDRTRDWSWLRRIAGRVRARHVPARAKRPRLVGAEELYALGQQQMAAAAGRDAPRRRAIMFRDGLLVALLASRPVRRRNLAGLRFGTTLMRHQDLWWIDLPEGSTKTGAPLTMPLPAELSAAVDQYRALYHPVLLTMRGRWYSSATAESAATAVWISTDGSAMTEMALYDRIAQMTKTAFGRSISPHLFRDCAATSIAIGDPGHVRIAASLLGHRTFTTTERHYNHARQREAAALCQEHILTLRTASDSSR
jgi:integrase/recombinase XerD